MIKLLACQTLCLSLEQTSIELLIYVKGLVGRIILIERRMTRSPRGRKGYSFLLGQNSKSGCGFVDLELSGVQKSHHIIL